MTPVNWVGLCLQVIGIGIAGAGLRQTWREVDGTGFWDPARRPLVGATSWTGRHVVGTLRRLLRRSGNVIVRDVTSALSLGSALNARVRTGFGPLPEDQDELRREVERRLATLNNALQDLGDRLADHEAAVRSQLDHLRNQARADVDRLKEETRRSTMRGVRLESAGLFVVLIGTVLQAI